MGIQASVKDSILGAGTVSLHLTPRIRSGVSGQFPGSSTDRNTSRSSVCYIRTSKKRSNPVV